MDKSKRNAIMSKFLKKGKPQKSATSSGDDKNGFYETLVVKKQKNVQQPIKKDPEICKKIGNIRDLAKKKYMIPSQFPNITQSYIN
jgi:hypothetical protein